MTSFRFCVVLSVFLTLGNTQHRQDLSTFVTNTNLGQIKQVTDKKILNAFVKANPQLPQELRDTTLNGLIYVSVAYPDNRRALIDIRSGPSLYTGHVEVFFNGGPLPTTPASPLHHGSGKLNLSRLTNLNLSLGLQKGGVRVTDDQLGRQKIIQAFMSKNNLPIGLGLALRVGRITRNSASLYVEQPNFEYEGNVNVSL